MTVHVTEVRAYPPPPVTSNPLGGLCRGHCKRCGLRWWSPDPVAVAREHERECPGSPRTSIYDGTR